MLKEASENVGKWLKRLEMRQCRSQSDPSTGVHTLECNLDIAFDCATVGKVCCF